MQYGNGGSTVQFDTILVERLDGVARITLNRPDQANALSQLTLTEIGNRAWHRAAQATEDKGASTTTHADIR